MVNQSKKYLEPSKPVGTVAELFAGVGGFRIGLANAGWKTVFSNQWEPATKVQHASSVYVGKFGDKGHSCEDIAKVEKIPAKFDLLVGGFPCQDYSVAKTLATQKDCEVKRGSFGGRFSDLLNCTNQSSFSLKTLTDYLSHQLANVVGISR